MSEVYRAEDTNLKREVAIKVLPAAFAQDSKHMKLGVRRRAQRMLSARARLHLRNLPTPETAPILDLVRTE